MSSLGFKSAFNVFLFVFPKTNHIKTILEILSTVESPILSQDHDHLVTVLLPLGVLERLIRSDPCKRLEER